MSPIKPSIEQVDPPRSPREILPTMYDLPSEAEAESGLPDECHLWQADRSTTGRTFGRAFTTGWT